MDQLPDELIVHMINVSDISTASKLILVNRHLDNIAMEQIIIARNNHPAWKILQTSIGKDNELVIDDMFKHYEKSCGKNVVLQKEFLTNMLALCFLNNTVFYHNNIEIRHSTNTISLHCGMSNTEHMWGTYAHATDASGYYVYFEYAKILEIFDFCVCGSITFRSNDEQYLEFDTDERYDIEEVFSSILPETSLQFWFPTGGRKDEFYKLLRAGELPYPHPDTITGPGAAEYRELYYTL
jgi:hypothetical protein